MKSLVSVVITTYKREVEVLKQSVDSVLGQTYDNIEIIVVDDNYPNDRYHKDVQGYLTKWPQIHYIKNLKNEGVQYSRNIGIMQSKGDFVAFLDDDDIWLPTKIEKQLALFKTGVGMVFCGGENFYDDNINNRDDYYNKEYFGRPIDFYAMLENGDYIGSTSQVIVRKSCFARTGMFDCDFLSRQDYEMWLRISMSYGIVAVEEPLFLYREHKGTRVSTNYSNLINGYENLLRKYRSQYKKVPAGKCMIEIKLANCYLKNGKYTLALSYLIRAFILSPSRFIKIAKRHS